MERSPIEKRVDILFWIFQEIEGGVNDCSLYPIVQTLSGLLLNMPDKKSALKKRLIKFLGNKYDWDKHRVQFRLTRVLIAE